MLGVSSNLMSTSNRKDLTPITSTTFVSGSSDYIVVSNHIDLQATDITSAKDFSTAFWFKATVDATSTSNLDGYIGIKAGAFESNGFYFWYDDAAGDSEKIQVRTNTASASSALTTTGDTIDHNTWYHIAYTYDVSETTGRIYIDGSLNNTNTSQSIPTKYTGEIHIGSSNTNSKFVSSVTSDLAFWKGAILSAEDIEALSRRTVSPPQLSYSSLSGYWRFDSDSATGSNGVLDISGNGHHGTSSGLADADFDTEDTTTGV